MESDGLSDEEIEKMCCPNGSFTCGLLTKLDMPTRCNKCKGNLTKQEKSNLLDKLVAHAETIEKDEWVQGKLLSQSLRNQIKSHALWFLKIYRKATNNSVKIK